MPSIFGGIQTGKVIKDLQLALVAPREYIQVDMSEVDCRTGISIDVSFDADFSSISGNDSGGLYIIRRSQLMRSIGSDVVNYAGSTFIDLKTGIDSLFTQRNLSNFIPNYKYGKCDYFDFGFESFAFTLLIGGNELIDIPMANFRCIVRVVESPIVEV